MGGLHYLVTAGSCDIFLFCIDDLINYFKKFGDVENGSVIFSRDNHKSRGFGFVIFKNYESVEKALNYTSHSIMGRKIDVKLAVPKQAIENHPEDNRSSHYNHLTFSEPRQSFGQPFPLDFDSLVSPLQATQI